MGKCERKVEMLLWSIALPGFGQFLNGKLFKGTVLLILEFLINVQGNFNEVIISSFHGEIEKAIGQADYQWLMFYPCLYFYAMWDAWKDAGGRIVDSICRIV
jgi:TM2 domain-containing membrane protein YozV